jgi:hypothetical protein
MWSADQCLVVAVHLQVLAICQALNPVPAVLALAAPQAQQAPALAPELVLQAVE